MFSPVSAIAAGAWSAVKADLGAALWAAANARQVAATLQTMFEMQLRGGTVVLVPAGNPVICTLIQLDGDIVTKVNPGVFESHSGDELKLLIAQHQAALEARLPTLGPRVAESVAGCLRSLLFINWAAQFVTVGIGVIDTWAQLLAAELLDAFWLLFPYLAASLIILLIRLAAPPLLQEALRRGLLHFRH